LDQVKIGFFKPNWLMRNSSLSLQLAIFAAGSIEDGKGLLFLLFLVISHKVIWER
jgi:hypothetical protein